MCTCYKIPVIETVTFFFLFVFVSQLRKKCNSSFLFLLQFSVQHDQQTHTHTLSLSIVSVSQQTQFFLHTLSLSLPRLIFFSLFFSNKPQNLQPPRKKNCVVRVLSALCTSAHCRSLIFFLLLLLLLLLLLFFFLSSSVNDDDYYTHFRACLLYAYMCLSVRLFIFWHHQYSSEHIYSRKIITLR